MKHTFTGMMIAMMLVLTLVIGAVALAENVEPEAPAIEQTEPEQAEQAPAESEAPATDETTDSTALNDAFKAYKEAKSSSRMEALEAELKGYVESGKLTQGQADLILNYFKERQSLSNGSCPSCGYQFQSGWGKSGRMGNGFGGKSGRMGGGFSGFGGRGMKGQQRSQNQNSGSTGGMSFAPGAQSAPNAAGTEGI